MEIPVNKTDIHLVKDLRQALALAHDLGAMGIGLDLEGVLGNYVGNEPYPNRWRNFLAGQGAENFELARADIASHPDVKYGILTNNANYIDPALDEQGIASYAAGKLSVPVLHSAMCYLNGEIERKPKGDQASVFCKTQRVRPDKTVLIDDQGVKNAGEAIKAGLQAIIVPDPIGLRVNANDRVIEHKWVGRARPFEPIVYRSLEKRGRLARLAYGKLAGIEIDAIGTFADHRT